MSLVLTFPTSAELNTVVQAFTPDPTKYIGMQILPMAESMFQEVQWDERDHDRGLTAPHLLGTDPKIDKRQGSVLRKYEPIHFKESDLLKEDEILKARQLGTMSNTIDLSEEIARIARNRWVKTMGRVEKLIWDCLKGAIAINENGVVVNETFPIQTHTLSTGWDSLSSATPLKDLNAMKLLFRKTGASAAGAKLYMNQKTCNFLLENRNDNDLKGFQNSNFTNLTYSLEELNKILVARGLPTIVVYDEGYVDESDNYVPFLGDGEAVLVGKRPAGQDVGDFVSTASLHNQRNNQPAPGYFAGIEVNGVPGDQVGSVSMSQLGMGKNPKIEIFGGIYGGPRLVYPKSVINIAGILD